MAKCRRADASVICSCGRLEPTWVWTQLLLFCLTTWPTPVLN